ncbi:MAG: low molecular weight protein-tyrosine-phosphatase [Candidatus Hydrogenedentales bacterium]
MPNISPKVSVLFVCLGNICRSPTAEGIFRRLLKERGYENDVHIDSSGTSNYHLGEPPDSRAIAKASKCGIDIANLRGRQVTSRDFEQFDYILAMDAENLRDLLQRCPPRHRDRVRLLMEFAPHLNVGAVPDPYFGGEDGFDHVYELIEAASEGLLRVLERDHLEITRD